MGGKSKGGGGGVMAALAPAISNLANSQARIANTIFDESTPLRQDILGSFGPGNPNAIDNLVGPVTTQNVEQSPLFGAIKTANERQFDLARSRVLENVPRGGALSSALADVEGRRAGALSSAMGGLAGDELTRRMNLFNLGSGIATGTPGVALGGLSGASNTLQGLANAQASMAESAANRSSAGKNAAGQAAGTIAAAAIKS